MRQLAVRVDEAELALGRDRGQVGLGHRRRVEGGEHLLDALGVDADEVAGAEVDDRLDDHGPPAELGDLGSGLGGTAGLGPDGRDRRDPRCLELEQVTLVEVPLDECGGVDELRRRGDGGQPFAELPKPLVVVPGRAQHRRVEGRPVDRRVAPGRRLDRGAAALQRGDEEIEVVVAPDRALTGDQGDPHPVAAGRSGARAGGLRYRLGAIGVVGDRARDPRPQRPRQVVAHSLDQLDPGGGDRRSDRLAGARRHQPVGLAVDDQRRALDPAELGRPVPRGHDRHQLSGRAGRVVAAVVHEQRPLAERLVIGRIAWRADPREERCDVGGVGLPLLRRLRQQRPHHAEPRHHARPPPARAGHDRAERRDPLGMAGGERLGDHPAHRGADEMGAVDADPVEEAGRVGRHLGQRVARRPGQPERPRDHVRRAAADFRREADVAVVEADDLVTAVDELPAEVLVPGEHLHPEPHHEQDRRVGRIPEGLVGELDPAADVGGPDAGAGGVLDDHRRPFSSNALSRASVRRASRSPVTALNAREASLPAFPAGSSNSFS